MRRGAMRAAGRRGFTLLEVIVAVAIASFTVAALYGLFTVQTRQFVTQDLQMEMHQNLRFATEMVTRSLRMAGYNTDGRVYGVMGYPTDADDLPVVIPWDADGANGTDAVTVVFGDPDLVMDTENDVIESYTTTQISFRPNLLDNASKLSRFEQDDLLLCFDYANNQGMETYMWSVASDYSSASPGVITVSDNSGYSDYANLFSTNANLAPIMSCTKGDVYTFYVDDVDGDDPPGTSAHPVLMLDLNMNWPDADDVPLVDNIEDFQVEYCLDDGTGTVDCSDSTNWVDTFDTDNVEHLWMARVSIVARSSREETRGTYDNKRPALANRSGASTTDHYFREVLVTEVTLRNLRYQDTMAGF